jgi:ABC-type antimicrobial peptide transport system, ATPase component
VVIRNDAPHEPAPTQPSVTQPLVASLRGVWKVYNPGSPGEVTALAGIDLDISAGESVALVGPSGCGKSTLLAILGLLDRPTQGSVTIAGSEVSQASRRSLPVLRNRYIGFVFQHHHLLPTLTAAENVAVPLRLQGRSRAEALKAAGRWLDRLGLSHRRNHLPEQLSGGERQRVAVARALVSKPALLLADEPTGELDSTNAEKLVELLLSLHRELGQTLVVATHDPQLAARCHRLLELKDGRIVADRAASHPE